MKRSLWRPAFDFQATDGVWIGWMSSWFVLEMIAFFVGPTGIWTTRWNLRKGRGLVPWVTLSEWGWDLEREWLPFQMIFFLGLGLLGVHIAFKWPFVQETD